MKLFEACFLKDAFTRHLQRGALWDFFAQDTPSFFLCSCFLKELDTMKKSFTAWLSCMRLVQAASVFHYCKDMSVLLERGMVSLAVFYLPWFWGCRNEYNAFFDQFVNIMNIISLFWIFGALSNTRSKSQSWTSDLVSEEHVLPHMMCSTLQSHTGTLNQLG